jgi:hypothetical protein
MEHVFNFPVAIRNCLEMVKRGGHFFATTPANNYFGHGFYQFSAELFFRVLAPANGLQIQHCVTVEYGLRLRWFAVTDPAAFRARVTLINAAPVVLFVWAKRVEIVPLFRGTPQQSDYASAWAISATQASVATKNKTAPQKLQRLQRTMIRTCRIWRAPWTDCDLRALTGTIPSNSAVPTLGLQNPSRPSKRDLNRCRGAISASCQSVNMIRKGRRRNWPCCGSSPLITP